jgi:putative DNA primase/helicase
VGRGHRMPDSALAVVGLESKVGARVNLTDLGNAMRLVERHGDDLLYVYDWDRWLVFDGRRWKVDSSGEVERRAKETVRWMYHKADPGDGKPLDAELAKHAQRSEAKPRIEAMISLARSEPRIAVTPEELDADPWALNVENGTVDTRTGELREHYREDLVTKLAPVQYDPDAVAPTWESFLERVLPNEELRGFVQRAAGYSATGDTSEQCLFIHHGPGANGKSTYQETISAALGDYAMKTPTETLLAKHSSGIPNDIARLKGARCVSASETEEGRRLAESRVKDLTGSDTISARFMRSEFFDFKPTHKLHLSTNHKPEIRGTDLAIWRRIRLVPWTVIIPKGEQDRKLADKLKAELPGVLAWIVRGCLEWQRRGLEPPDEVRRATGRYRAEMDVLAAFIDEECIVSESATATAKALYSAYREWAEENGEKPESQRRFGGRLKERGFDSGRITSGPRKGAVEWYGIGLSGGPEGSPDGERFTGQKSSKSATNEHGLKESGEQSEPEMSIISENSSRRVISEKGSLHSLGSPESQNCAHGLAGGRGCYLCDPSHPYRVEDGGAA